MNQLNVKIVSGAASADELAAVIAVISAFAARSDVSPNIESSLWSNPSSMHRRSLPSRWSSSFTTR